MDLMRVIVLLTVASLYGFFIIHKVELISVEETSSPVVGLTERSAAE
jgi:hypothetical protein